MALSEIEHKKIEKALGGFMARRRPPAHLRDQLDLGHRITGQSVEIFEVRPQWDNPSDCIEIPIAKATYVRSNRSWKIYWQRADLKWHRYEPQPSVRSIDNFLAVVEADEYACFFG
ncbi:DUF3024 domain-containing protein [Halomonas sp. ML-15]|uniref:DUF3024 domain-containing protein n=1 Tax=Halomonas sp. ML-15 TaxID=2773305 RepID=UPI00174715DA|nr:DUF3024 domain-containing protein [Halomonas sp. ML-15]MBD3896896.1 DUF3024 domain-containing protein [Halomonas sp. ML-15]